MAVKIACRVAKCCAQLVRSVACCPHPPGFLTTVKSATVAPFLCVLPCSRMRVFCIKTRGEARRNRSSSLLALKEGWFPRQVSRAQERRAVRPLRPSATRRGPPRKDKGPAREG